MRSSILVAEREGKGSRVTIVVPGEPPKATAQHGLHIAKGRLYRKPQPAIEAMKAMLEPFVPAKPMSGPLIVRVVFEYPYRKSDLATKAKRDHLARVPWCPMDAKPDVDNLAKGLLDAMTKLGFWEDDAQIFDLRIQKRRGHNPRLEIEITPFTGDREVR